MLTDTTVEEEFEIKEEEPWYDKQDLEHDLQLAAELGKTLLERNRELEQGLQQMYSTNQEQLQEIEYLTKQVDLLRQVNDQHAKVYEQLDVSARELEHSNHKLVVDNRTAQQRIQGLAETVELLQTQVEELQHQVEELKLSPQPQKPPHREGWSTRSSQSVSCLKELQNTLRYDCDPDEPSDDLESSDMSWHEEEQESLRQSLRALQTQFAVERARREETVREAELLAGENATLEQQLTRMEGCQVRVQELEREAEELRQLWKSQSSTRASRPDSAIHNLLPESLLLHPEEEENEGDAAAARGPWVLKRWGQERPTRAPQLPDCPDRIYDHECSCVRRAEVVKYRGISLLNEVDAQYSALQVKYDELLQRCHPGPQEADQDGQSHKSVQTPSLVCPALKDMEDFEDDFHQPEYKELFREIFSRIRKTKEDLIENRGGTSNGGVLPISH
ncbi:cerebellar degeneration-related protein 2-like [Hippoglossus hippoglossus]|uniref:cerebellar degeneration-related protein 2-like n=1 Tax=Hippoglossus hippoglossus TaxID=8267 RepID=UPI00148C3C88|nr:cerebellar degeneration-related protein 2-like [Hippoglossus hippoglossus]XP_034427183.1 cerebellar degeneration-related protein 2-like [Hippoglossus hippoglossus]